MRDHLASLVLSWLCGAFLLSLLVGCTKPPVNLEQRILALEEARVLQAQKIKQYETEVASLRTQLQERGPRLEQQGKDERRETLALDGQVPSQVDTEKDKASKTVEDQKIAEAPTGKVDALAQDLVKTHGGQDAGEIAYEAALDLLRNKNDVTGAKKAFDDFLITHKDHRLIPNAFYWLGETHYVQKRFAQAILTYKEIPKRFPTHTKAADALFKIGLAYISLGDIENARFNLETLVKEYPKSSAAPLAEERLKKIK